MGDVREPDAEDRAAAAALVWRLKNRGPGDGQFSEDPEVFAAEFIASLRGYGWRPTNARPGPGWKSRQGGTHLPEQGRPGGAEYLEAKAAVLARATGPMPVLTEGRDP